LFRELPVSIQRALDTCAIPFDLQLLQETGRPELVLEGVRENFSLSGDGTLVYTPTIVLNRDTVNEVVLVDLEGNPTTLIDELNLYKDVRRSPDGRRLALTVDGLDGDRQVWIYDVDGDSKDPIGFEGRSRGPLWFLDSARVAFTSSAGMQWTPADNPNFEPELLTTARGAAHSAGSFSPDGKTLAFHGRNPESLLPDSLVPRNFDIMILAMEGDGIPEPFIATSDDENSPRFSPDGQWMTYTSRQTGGWHVYITPYPDVAPKRVSPDGGGGLHAVWALDGRTIYYRTGTHGEMMMSVEIETEPELALGEPTLLFERGGYDFWPDRAQYDIAPSGDGFVMLTWPHSAPGEISDTINVVFDWAKRLKAQVPPGR